MNKSFGGEHLISGPGDVKTKSRVKINVPSDEYEHYERSHKKLDEKAIWDINEVQSVPFCDDASYDPRQRPNFDIKYRQAVTSEDLYLQVTLVLMCPINHIVNTAPLAFTILFLIVQQLWDF